MREALDHWPFIIAAYTLVIIGTLGMVLWSWLAMRCAEKRRDKARRK